LVEGAGERIIDALGLKCPLPVLLARRALGPLAPGAIIAVHADDPLAKIDLPAFCNSEGHALLGVETSMNGQIFRIRKA
jgi:tRNA 2-thiouridine synthesizing protein A